MPTDTQDNSAPGWEAIDHALASLYPEQEPKHYGTLIGWRLGGPDPLDGISAWKRMEPLPHWHFVSYGLTELFQKGSDDPEVSGYGFELTFRLACAPDEEEPPAWALNLLQDLARYVFQSGNAFDDGHWMSANGPLGPSHSGTALCSMAFIFDPELPAIDTPNGHMTFLQIVGLTGDEEWAAKCWNTRALLETLLPDMPLWITDPGRASLLDRASIRAQAEAGMRRDGSSSGFLFTDVLSWQKRERPPLIEIVLGAQQVRELVILLPLRLPFDRPFRLIGHNHLLRFERSDANHIAEADGVLTLYLTDATEQTLARTLPPRAGSYILDGLEGVSWRIEQTPIRDAQGAIVETIG